MSAALSFDIEEKDLEFEITVEEPAPDLVEEVAKVAKTFESSPSQEELNKWEAELKLDAEIVAEIVAEMEAAWARATVEIGIEPDYEWLDQVANGMPFEVNPVVN